MRQPAQGAAVRQPLLLSLLLLLSMASAESAHARIYQWIDEAGQTHISDKPPATGAFHKIEVKPNTVSSPARPATAVQPQPSAGPDKHVIMYSAEWCGICTRARRYFNANNIPFTEYDIDKSTQGRRDYNRLGGRGVPLILIDKQRLNGFSAHTFQRIYQKP